MNLKTCFTYKYLKNDINFKMYFDYFYRTMNFDFFVIWSKTDVSILARGLDGIVYKTKYG